MLLSLHSLYLTYAEDVSSVPVILMPLGSQSSYSTYLC